MTNLIETMAKAMAERIIRGEAGELLQFISEDEMRASIDRMWREWCEPDARAALSAIEAAGYRVVPVEPTEVMVSFTHDELCEPEDPTDSQIRAVWALMLYAAPKVTE